MNDDVTANPTDMPKHVAIIMDGNGRWARARGEERTFGHSHGAKVAADIALAASDLGLEALTLYSFSTENWKRPPAEVEYLMQLGHGHLKENRDKIGEYNIRFRHVGSGAGIPEHMLADIRAVEEATASHTGMTLCLALNYGSRQEITEAVRSIAADAAAGKLSPDEIDERTIGDRLYTSGLPDPDLLIRTAGEMRVSNFLLWQISYAELWVTPTLWPDFTMEEFKRSLQEYTGRHRKFGDVPAEA